MMLTFNTIILRIIELLLFTYKFSRDVVFADNRNPGFSQFYFWESFVVNSVATWYYAL